MESVIEAAGTACRGSLAHQLAQTWPSVAAYVVSFFVVGVIWVNHHALFTLIEVAKHAVRRFGLGTIAYPVATAAGLFWPPLILIAIGVLAVYYMAEQTQILPNSDRAELNTEGG